MRNEFIQDGVSEDVLEKLKKMWENKLKEKSVDVVQRTPGAIDHPMHSARPPHYPPMGQVQGYPMYPGVPYMPGHPQQQMMMHRQPYNYSYQGMGPGIGMSG